ncbi:MAG: hypothetical protein V3U74_04310 [Thermodesulfobacteriota bacterium]
MKNLKMVDYNEAGPEVREMYDLLKKKIGMIPNLYATTANSPVALKAIKYSKITDVPPKV